MCLQPSDYMSILQLYLGNEAYYLGPNGEPMISTFQSGGFSNATFNCELISSWLRSITVTDAFSAWRSSLDNKLYFVPMFDDTNGYYDSAAGVSLPASSDLPNSQIDIDGVVVLLGRRS